MIHVPRLTKVLQYLREELDDKITPIYWIEFLLLISEQGDKGVATIEVAEHVDMLQSTASRTVNHLSQYWDKKANKMVGMGLIIALQNDPHFRQRQRLYLTPRGKRVVAQIEQILSNEH